MSARDNAQNASGVDPTEGRLTEYQISRNVNDYNIDDAVREFKNKTLSSRSQAPFSTEHRHTEAHTGSGGNLSVPRTFTGSRSVYDFHPGDRTESGHLSFRGVRAGPMRGSNTDDDVKTLTGKEGGELGRRAFEEDEDDDEDDGSKTVIAPPSGTHGSEANKRRYL